jgi:molybdate transport system substrate-binding protein
VDEVAELLAVPGIDVVGPLPGNLQTTMTYTAGVPAGAKNSEPAKGLVKFLTSEAAATVIRHKGMDPS